MAINTNKLVVGNQKREDFLKGQVYIRNFSHIYCFQECVYWTKGIDKEWKVYGSRLQNQNESLIIEKRTMDFEEFLKEIFFKNSIILIESDFVFLINPTNFKVIQLSKDTFLTDLVGYRRINKHNMCFIFYNNFSNLKTVFIKCNYILNNLCYFNLQDFASLTNNLFWIFCF